MPAPSSEPEATSSPTTGDPAPENAPSTTPPVEGDDSEATVSTKAALMAFAVGGLIALRFQ